MNLTNIHIVLTKAEQRKILEAADIVRLVSGVEPAIDTVEKVRVAMLPDGKIVRNQNDSQDKPEAV